MKKLRFRAVELPTSISCGANTSKEVDGIYPVHYIWNSGGGFSEITVTNFTDNPIKVKIFVDGILDSQSSYIGNPSLQGDLDIFNITNFHPQETISNISSIMLTASGTSVSSIVDIKIYCPFIGSAFGITLNCP